MGDSEGGKKVENWEKSLLICWGIPSQCQVPAVTWSWARRPWDKLAQPSSPGRSGVQPSAAPARGMEAQSRCCPWGAGQLEPRLESSGREGGAAPSPVPGH